MLLRRDLYYPLQLMLLTSFHGPTKKWTCDYLKVTVRGRSDTYAEGNKAMVSIWTDNPTLFNRFGYTL